jgi:hypothetical protein
MNTYYKILQIYGNIIPYSIPEKETYKFISSPNPIKKETIQILYGIINTLFFYEKNNKKIIKKKFFLFYKKIQNNIFIKKETKQELEEIFNKSQKTYLSLLKFSNIIKSRYASVKVKTDLCGAPIKNKIIINETHSSKSVTRQVGIINTAYWFSPCDLINIIMNAITYSDYLVHVPLDPRNPYTNINFTKTQLYNIYIKLHLETNYILPTLLTKYFLCEFNLKKFQIENECYIREHIIKSHVTNSSFTLLYDDIMEMIEIYFTIDKDFPKAVLVEIMRPYLYLFYITNYHIRGVKKIYNAKQKLKEHLKIFYKFNPQFGRKYIINSKKKVFNTKHPIFNLHMAKECLY